MTKGARGSSNTSVIYPTKGKRPTGGIRRGAEDLGMTCSPRKAGLTRRRLIWRLFVLPQKVNPLSHVSDSQFRLPPAHPKVWRHRPPAHLHRGILQHNPAKSGI